MVAYPLVVTLFVCKTILGGPADINSGDTGWQNRDWDLDGGKYHCRRIQVEVTSVAEGQGQEAPPWTPDACMRTAMTLGPAWDAAHASSNYRFRWVACPTPIHASKDASSPVIGYKIPECPYKEGTVLCEQDSVI